MSLGSNIYDLRSKAGLSQEELAEKLGVSRQSVSKWETDTSVPDVDKLIQLSKVFGITLDELVNGATDQQPHTPLQEPTKIEYVSEIKSSTFRTRKIIGAVLIGVSLLAVFLSLIFPNDLTPLIIITSVYFLLCGILCEIIKKRLILSIIALTVFVLCIGVIVSCVFYMGFVTSI